jgi:dTDP-4-dehydrorhamnose 3,5-epimerase
MKQEEQIYEEGNIDGVEIRPLKRCEDSRGWLIELYREDKLETAIHPVMAYASQTLPGVARGPHEHRYQTDYFVFAGPGDFKVYLWDSREGSSTLGFRQVFVAGESNNIAVIIPPGVVHAYKCVSTIPGFVINTPNRLYAGQGKTEEVDEIRYEDKKDATFIIN